MTYNAFALASPGWRARMLAPDTELPEVRARGTAPAGNAPRKHPGPPIPAVLA